MADFFDSLKKAWIKAIEVVGDTATNLADSAKTKVDEMNLSTSRKDLLYQLGEIAYQLWLEGQPFPQELEEMFATLKEFDDQLSTIAAQRNAAKEEKIQKATQAAMEEEELAAKTKEILHEASEKEENLDQELPAEAKESQSIEEPQKETDESLAKVDVQTTENEQPSPEPSGPEQGSAPQENPSN